MEKVQVALKPVIRDHILNSILQQPELAINDDTPLIEDGYVTSLQAVELVMFLEEQFGIQIDPEEVNEEEFRSLNTIAGLVQRKLG